MGTRATITIKDGKDTLIKIYRQMDGYPSGLGAEIKQILDNGHAELVNGYQLQHQSPKTFNGMGCLAAFLIGALKIVPYGMIGKNPIGNVYITSPNAEPEEYNYILYANKENELCLEIKTYEGKELFKDVLSKFDPEKFD